MSLQDQLLKAGLTTANKANKAKSAQRKQKKMAKKHKLDIVDENKIAAEQAIKEQAEKARQLNLAKNAQAEEKAIIAQVKQIIESNQQDTGKPQVSFNFSDNGAIKKLEVSNQVHRHLTKGLLAIAIQGNGYALVPKVIADKINERASDFILLNNDKVESEKSDEDDYYSDYEIPDDLMW